MRRKHYIIIAMGLITLAQSIHFFLSEQTFFSTFVTAYLLGMMTALLLTNDSRK